MAMQACIPSDVMRAFVVYNNNDRDVLRGLINNVAKGSALSVSHASITTRALLIDPPLRTRALHGVIRSAPRVYMFSDGDDVDTSSKEPSSNLAVAVRLLDVRLLRAG